MNVERIELPGMVLTRVGYVDVGVPCDLVGLAPAVLDRIDWAGPRWRDGESVRVGAAVWFADIAGTRLAFDPVQATDSTLRATPEATAFHQNAIATLLAEAGFPRESVDVLVLTHIEGVGMTGWQGADGRWSPFFPRATVRVSATNLAAFSAAAADATPDQLERDAWNALIALGVVTAYDDGEALAPGLRAHVSGGHGPGHAVLHLTDQTGAIRASFIGHLAVSPLHLASGECPALNSDPALAWRNAQALLEDERLLIGPLWPSPGFATWRELQRGSKPGGPIGVS